ELDGAGRELGVHGRGLARHHLAGDRDHALGAHRLGRLEHRARDVDYDLGDAVMVAQVDEQQIAMIALALDPARQAGLLADMFRPQLAARMGSVDRRHSANREQFPGLNGAAKGTDCGAKSREWPCPPIPAGRNMLYRAPPMKLITTTDELAAFCKPLARAEFVTVDTEFMRERTYWPKLCLAQVAGPDEAAAIDALAEGMDLAPLDELMGNPKVLKVFHAARQDLEIFYLRMKKVPAPLFDTQVAAMVCGHGDAASYESLATKLAEAPAREERSAVVDRRGDGGAERSRHLPRRSRAGVAAAQAARRLAAAAGDAQGGGGLARAHRPAHRHPAPAAVARRAAARNSKPRAQDDRRACDDARPWPRLR